MKKERAIRMLCILYFDRIETKATDHPADGLSEKSSTKYITWL
jgi:hypothetical protein